jgi:hypothetical protein
MMDTLIIWILLIRWHSEQDFIYGEISRIVGLCPSSSSKFGTKIAPLSILQHIASNHFVKDLVITIIFLFFPLHLVLSLVFVYWFLQISSLAHQSCLEHKRLCCCWLVITIPNRIWLLTLQVYNNLPCNHLHSAASCIALSSTWKENKPQHKNNQSLFCLCFSAHVDFISSLPQLAWD